MVGRYSLKLILYGLRWYFGVLWVWPPPHIFLYLFVSLSIYLALPFGCIGEYILVLVCHQYMYLCIAHFIKPYRDPAHL